MATSAVMADVRVVPSGDISPAGLERLRRLLNEAFDDEFSDDNWEHSLGGFHAIVAVDGVPVSHAAVVPREIQVGSRVLQCGYVEAVATAPSARGRGLATRAMKAAMDNIRTEVDLGVLSTEHHRFYERLGWERWQGPTSVIRNRKQTRTPDEDDGIMVLRFGASTELSLRDPITCWPRRGDDW